MNEIATDAPSPESISDIIQRGSFEEALEALQLVVEYLERGRMTIDESVAWYEAGLGLTQRCNDLLEQAELRVSKLDAKYLMPSRGDTTWVTEESCNGDAQLRFTDE